MREVEELRQEIELLQQELNKLHGHIFSKRDYDAMLSRIEQTQQRAEQAEAIVARVRAAVDAEKGRGFGVQLGPLNGPSVWTQVIRLEPIEAALAPARQDGEVACGVRGKPSAGPDDRVRVCELPKGHEGYHRDGTVSWLGYHAEEG